MRYLFRDLAESARRPEFWVLSSWLDIVVRYRQSRFGLFWLMAPALVYVWGVGWVFASMQNLPLAIFAAHVAIGYSLFRMINAVIIESTTAFASAGPFILDGHVRLTDFVLRVVAKALFYFLMSLPVVAVALLMYPRLQLTGLLLCLLSLPLVLLNVLWAGILLGLVGARYRDLSQLISNVFMFAFLLTPIIWHADSMPAGSVRGSLMRLNPLFHMIEVVRAPILGDAVELGTYYYLAVMTVLGWIVAVLAYRRYARFVALWV